jgi:hypothetical protein
MGTIRFLDSGEKMKTLTRLAIACAASIVLFAPLARVADAQGRHPRYLKSRSDLRAAQFLLRVHEEPNVTRNLKLADEEAEHAIHEIDQAAVLDGKDLNDHPPVDVRIPRVDRFRKIAELLRVARAGIDKEEDNPAARGWRDVAFRHIDAALDFLRRAAVDAHIDHELGY